MSANFDYFRAYCSKIIYAAVENAILMNCLDRIFSLMVFISGVDQIRAVEGCTYVCHVASPFILDEPDDPMDLIKPAVDGTIAVLEACSNSGTVKRVCLTSSIAAIRGNVHIMLTFVIIWYQSFYIKSLSFYDLVFEACLFYASNKNNLLYVLQ